MLRSILLSVDELKKSQYLDQLIEVVSEFRKRPVKLNSYLKEVPDGATYLLLILDNKVIGVLRYYPHTPSYMKKYKINNKYKDYFSVASVIISEKNRGKGYGKILMKKLIKKTNGKKLMLDTYLSWLPAVKLYLSVGFHIVNTYKSGNEYILQFVY